MIDKINIAAPQVFSKPNVQQKTASSVQTEFSHFLKDAINNVNESQKNSDIMTEKLIKGENVDLHQVMIASQKASVSLQATLQIRNKVIEAYQEIMRMQV
ncbi:flagellar hook-basal body complex protein FliE [Bacillus sp. REN16]|uniref:flagellar hook-basal body complex protein FliE n=1 Tax=Bacillus sp. REN16 TaxID=2887296 RepID=UPI001E431AF0|nr:flagellar hook-basal body complex protein FliE [Bacillus sp. REN16]MCC3357477.1 flagellar hook-basal body complex protein FliE [Bacillus sp. REN16]